MEREQTVGHSLCGDINGNDENGEKGQRFMAPNMYGPSEATIKDNTYNQARID